MIEALNHESELDVDLTRLHELLQMADIEGARAFVQQLGEKWPDSDRVRHFARVLAPPVVTFRPSKPGHSRHRERAWLREHAREYVGCWIALLGDQLLAADSDLGQVMAAVNAASQGENALLHFEPGAPD